MAKDTIEIMDLSPNNVPEQKYEEVIKSDVLVNPIIKGGNINGVPTPNYLTNKSGAISNVTGSRTWDTVYQNTSTQTIQVIIEVSGIADSDTWGAAGYSGISIPSITMISLIHSGITSGSISGVLQMTFFVLPGYYYKIARRLGTENINRWTEINFGLFG